MAGGSLRDRAIRLLARREYARAELERRLLARGGEPSAVRAVLSELESDGLLSDARYARAVVARRAGSFSRARIVDELKAAGLSRDEIEAAVGEADLDDDTALRALWQRRFGRAPADERDKARQVRFLQSRGFAISAILNLLRRAEGSPR